MDRQLTQMGWRKSLGQFSRPFPPSYDEAVMNSNLTETIQYQVPAPTYFTSHHSTPQYPDDPVIPYQVHNTILTHVVDFLWVCKAPITY